MMENTLLGNVRLIKEIGAGGMGTVWLGQHQTLEKKVAVKILPESLSKDPTFAARFVREARSAARLEHPNVIQVHDAANENGIQYIVMQYVDGIDLQKAIKRKGPLPVRDCLSIVKRVAAALQAAHDLGIMHRDVKPSNIMVTGKGRVFIGDFGLARDISSGRTVTGAEQVVGTPHYMSPEQARGERLDARSDIYSLGATLYAMLTARPPFEAETPVGVMVKHAREDELPEPIERVNPAIPPGVGAVVARMMAKSTKKRYASMKEVIAAIEGLKNGATQVPSLMRADSISEAPTLVAPTPPMPARPAVPTGVPRPSPKFRWWWVAIPAALFAGFMMLGVLALLVIGAQKSEEPEDSEEHPEAADAVQFEETSQWILDAFMRGEIAFGDAIAEFRTLQIDHPQEDRQRHLKDLLFEVNRHQVATRTADLLGAIEGDDFAAIAEHLHPGIPKADERRRLRALQQRFRRTLGNRDVVSVEPPDDAVDLNLREKRAVVHLEVKVRTDRGRIERLVVPIHWTLHENEWYVTPERLRRSFRRDP